MPLAESGDAEGLKALLEGAGMGATPEALKLALLTAAVRGHAGAVKVMLEAGADANATRDDGDTALHLAVMERHTDTLEVTFLKGLAVKP
eukprot:139856-Prorocentrum_minimum.AAC.1